MRNEIECNQFNTVGLCAAIVVLFSGFGSNGVPASARSAAATDVYQRYGFSETCDSLYASPATCFSACAIFKPGDSGPKGSSKLNADGATAEFTSRQSGYANCDQCCCS